MPIDLLINYSICQYLVIWKCKMESLIYAIDWLLIIRRRMVQTNLICLCRKLKKCPLLLIIFIFSWIYLYLSISKSVKGINLKLYSKFISYIVHKNRKSCFCSALLFFISVWRVSWYSYKGNLNTSDSAIHHTISLMYVGAHHLEFGITSHKVT